MRLRIKQAPQLNHLQPVPILLQDVAFQRIEVLLKHSMVPNLLQLVLQNLLIFIVVKLIQNFRRNLDYPFLLNVVHNMFVILLLEVVIL